MGSPSERLPLWDRIFLALAGLCLLVGITLMAACDPFEAEDEPDKPIKTKEIQY